MIIYGYFEKSSGDLIYVGIDTTENEERAGNHLKPSKRLVQPINTYLQDNPEDWIYKVLWRPNYPEFFPDKLKKEIIHKSEISLIERENPKYNVYGTKK